MKHAVKHIHFVGIGGSGMSAIAEVLHTLDYTISGSDQVESTTLKRLASLGIHTYVGDIERAARNPTITIGEKLAKQ